MANRQDRKTFELFVVEESQPNREGEVKSFWNKVGRGFENQDGSLSLRLFMHPGMLIQCREYVPRDNTDTNNRGDRDNRRGGRR